MDQLIKKEPKNGLKKFQNFGKLVNLENIKKVEESTASQVRSVEITNEKFDGIALAIEKMEKAISIHTNY